MKIKPNFIVLISIIFILGACSKIPEYSNVPKISLNEVEIIRNYYIPAANNYADSIILKINFEDGDGDLGSDTGTINNYFLNVERKENGVYNSFVDFNGKFPLLAPSNLKNPIDGVLNYSFLLEYSFVNKNDTVRFTISIEDRAKNRSNTIQTEPFIVRKN